MTEARNELVSFVIPVRNGSRFIRQSVASALGQTYSPIDVLVVDDGSTDDTREILEEIRDPRLRVVSNTGEQGVSGALNCGLEEARGRYVARLDSDDVVPPDRLVSQLALMRRNSRLSIVGSDYLAVAPGQERPFYAVTPRGPLMVRWWGLLSTPLTNVLIEREHLRSRSLAYRTEWFPAEDYDLWARALDVLQCDNVGKPLLLYRSHPAQTSRSRTSEQWQMHVRVARDALARVLGEAMPSEDVAALIRFVHGTSLDPTLRHATAHGYLDLFARFRGTLRDREGIPAVRRHVVNLVFNQAVLPADGIGRAELVRRLARLDPSAPLVLRVSERVRGRGRARGTARLAPSVESMMAAEALPSAVGDREPRASTEGADSLRSE